MLRINVNLVTATVQETEILTSGRVGLQCEFTFSDEWDGLMKTATFEGAESADVPMLASNTVTVPHECLSAPGAKLRVGVCGMNAAGDIVIPTIWANAGRIQQGAEPSGIPAVEPTPNWAIQVQQAAASALEIAREVKNEADNGDFDGVDGVSPAVTVVRGDSSATITVTDATGTTSVEIHDGQTGATGATGVTFTPSVDEDGDLSWTNDGGRTNPETVNIKGDPFTYDDFTEEQLAALTGPAGADGADGADGTDGVSPTISSSSITGGHRLTIVDVNGTTTVDVMDGEDGATGATGQTGATGNGIASILKTGSSGLVDTYTITYTNGNTTTFTVTNGADGDDGVVVRGTGTNSAVVINEDYPNSATGVASSAVGEENVASGEAAVAVGRKSIASGDYSFAGGNKSAQADYPTTASGNDSFAFGLSAKATGQLAVAFGQKTEASGNMCFVSGNNASATGNSTLSVGQYTAANANMAAALGNHTTATKGSSFVAGKWNVVDGENEDGHVLIIGNGTAEDARSNAFSVDWSGNGVFGGKLTVGAAPTNDLDVATKKYVDDNGGGGGGTPYTSNPEALGTASPGSSSYYSRGDHVHPMPSASDVGAYALPSGGIPSSDMTSAVQTSLGKADSAYQKPSGGIPAADLASGVIPTVPSAYTSTPAALGTASAGSATAWAKGDHVHAMPSAADVGAIASPSSPSVGDFLVYTSNGWAAQSLSTWSGGNY